MSNVRSLQQDGLPRAHANQSNIDNPVVFFDITMGGTASGRVVFELYADKCPRTAENFRQLCTGELLKNGIPVGYKNTSFFRIIKGFMVQGGDVENNNGTGRTSIFGPTFQDENFTLKHAAPFLLSMANSGPDTNGSQFFITLDKCEWLDNKHVVFGSVIAGHEVVSKMGNVNTNAAQNNRPTLAVVVANCGQL